MSKTFYGTGEYQGHYAELNEGSNYSIEVTQAWRGRIFVRVCHGYYWKPYQHLPVFCYRSLGEFLTAWNNVKSQKTYRFAE